MSEELKNKKKTTSRKKTTKRGETKKSTSKKPVSKSTKQSTDLEKTMLIPRLEPSQTVDFDVFEEDNKWQEKKKKLLEEHVERVHQNEEPAAPRLYPGRVKAPAQRVGVDVAHRTAQFSRRSVSQRRKALHVLYDRGLRIAEARYPSWQHSSHSFRGFSTMIQEKCERFHSILLKNSPDCFPSGLCLKV